MQGWCFRWVKFANISMLEFVCEGVLVQVGDIVLIQMACVEHGVDACGVQ